ncbi:MAG: AAA family ATPase [Gemmatimonadota bacterium]
MRSHTTRMATTLTTWPLISPLIPQDDFARLLTLDELEVATGRLAAAGRVVLCSALPEGLDLVRTEIGDSRAVLLLQELTLFVRRNLRGVDAVTVVGDEMLILLDTSGAPAVAVAERVMSAVRGHIFPSRGADGSHRLTFSMGLASAPEHGTSFSALVSAARGARAKAGKDGCAFAFSRQPNSLDLSRFVGRTATVAQLTGYLDDMARGVRRVVALVGESGVGTSSLVRTLTPEVRLRGGSLVVGSCRQTRFAEPYALWTEVLRAVRRLPIKSARAWRELPSLDPTLERVSDDIRWGGSKTNLLEELADFMRLAAQQRPLVLLLENLQWADSASWDGLEYLITQSESERILIALTLQNNITEEAGTIGEPSDGDALERQKSAEDDALERWRHLATRPRHSEIHLTHLTRDEVKRWLEAAMRTDELGRDLLTYVYRHSAGNPLVLVHLMRDLEESGHIVIHADGWQWSPVNELPTRVVLGELLARRLSRLPRAARSVLDAAAVLGRESEEALLLDCALGTTDARAGVEHLLECGLLVPTYDRGRAAYVVSHDEIARVATARLSVPDRVELHGRIARALVTQERPSFAEVAGHFEIANARPDAYRYALMGAQKALTVHEPAAVVELLEVAARNAPSFAELAEVRVRMAALAEEGGRFDEVDALAEQALEWYAAQGDAPQALRLKCMRVRVQIARGQATRDTLENLFALEIEARDADADPERAAILLLISQMHWRLGDLRAAQRVAAECVEIAERGSDVLLIADSCNRLAVTIQLEDAPRARELYNRTLEIVTAAGDAARRVRALNNIGVVEQIRANWDEAREALKLAIDQARTARLVGPWGRAELNLGVLEGRLGDYEGATTSLMEALRLTSMAQNGEEQMIATYNLAHNERERLHFREAIDTYSLVTELAERIGQGEVLAGALAGLGLCQLLTGDHSAAQASYRRAIPMMERLVNWFQGRELMEALTIRMLLAEGKVGEAAESFCLALAAAGPSDAYGAAWLTAEVGEVFGDDLPRETRRAMLEYSRHPEVLGNPVMRERLSVLKLDS